MKTKDQAALEAGTKLERLNAAAPDLLAALDNVPIHRLGETPEAFIARFKVWYRETRNPALDKAGKPQ